MGAGVILKRMFDTDRGLLWLARHPVRSPWEAVLIGVLGAAAVLLVRAAASGFYGSVTGFMILLPGVILAGLAGGLIAGLTAMAACLIGGWMLVAAAGGDDGVLSSLGEVATFNFIVVGLFSTLVSASLRKTLARLDASVAALEASGARIAETEARLHVISEYAPVMLWMSDAEGNCAHLNADQRQFWNAPEDLSGFDLRDVLHPEDRDRTMEVTRAAIVARQPFDIEARSRRHDGEWRWLRTTARPRIDRSGAFLGMIGVNVDVTEARAVEAALRESEARFRLMADTAPSPVWLTDAEGRVEFVNRALTEFYGLEADKLLGHVWRQTVHDDDRATIDEVQAAARPHHLPYGFEARFQRHGGQWRWMRIAVNPRFDANGAFVGYVGMSFDISDTRHALEDLARQERRQTFLLDLSDRLRDMESPDALMAEVEESLGAVLGADRVGYGEVDQTRGLVSVGRDWTDGVVSMQGEFSFEMFGPELINELIQGRTIRIPDVLEDPRTAGYAEAFVSVQTRALIRTPLVRAGRMRAFLYVHSAVPREWTDAEVKLVEEVARRTWTEVERARAQVDLRESEERFRAIADTAPVLIWVTQENRRRAFVNQAYVAFDGREYEQAVQGDWRNILHPEDRDRIVQESVAGEASAEPFSMEARYRRHDGEYRWLKSFSRPRLSGSGAVIGFVGVAFDVTDAKRAEGDLVRINELLEERVGEALAEKARAEANLMHAQRMEAVGRLTGGVAHDFNNLLTVVIGALDIILRTEDPAKRRKLGEAALSAARRGERLTHQLLAFSRRQALRPQAVDLNALIREGQPLLRGAVGEAVEFRLKLKRGGAHVNVDPAQFEAALLNLIVNARDAVGESGRITVQTLVCEVKADDVMDLAPGDYVCVTVTDDGSGMDPAILDQVFEPFFTTKAVGKGTGLGLSQVYGFARQSGGGVKITSEVGQGTEIRLFLPPLTTPLSTPVKRKAATRSVADGQRLLLVEDDAGVSAVAVDLIRDLGFHVTAVDSAQQALAALKRKTYDLMLTDIVMPGGMTGLELAHRCAETWPGMRIALASGYVGEDVDEALKDAPWPFLRKPYSVEDLSRVLLEDTLNTTGAP